MALFKSFLSCSLLCLCIQIHAQYKSKLPLYFESNSSRLDTAAENKLKKFLGNKHLTKVNLVGYCDSVGTLEFNDALAQKRVDAVKKQLLKLNVAEAIIFSQAKGERVLLKPGAKEEQKAENRRVDIQIEFKGIGVAAPVAAKQQTREMEIAGKVMDEDQKGLVAEVILSDQRGKELHTLTTNADGSYNFKYRLNTIENYYLSYYNDSSFIGGALIHVSKPQSELKNLKTILPKLRGGKNYELQNIHFEPGVAVFTKSSYPTLMNLYKLMKKNRSLVIQIEGHVNHPASMGIPRKDRSEPPGVLNRSSSTEWDLQYLSDERALAVKKFLSEKGIETIRLSRVGYSYHKMIFPYAETEEQMAKNRRVEIKVVSFGDNPESTEEKK